MDMWRTIAVCKRRVRSPYRFYAVRLAMDEVESSLSSIRKITESVDRSEQLTALGCRLTDDGYYRKAISVLEEAVAVGCSGEAQAAAHYSLAIIFTMQDNFKEADKHAETAMQIRMNALGPDAPQTLASQILLLILQIGRARDHKKVIAQLHEVIPKARQLGEGRSVADALAALAGAYLELEQPITAVKCYDEAMDVARDAYGPSHPRTLLIASECPYESIEKPAEAPQSTADFIAAHCEEAKKALRVDHPVRLQLEADTQAYVAYKELEAKEEEEEEEDCEGGECCITGECEVQKPTPEIDEAIAVMTSALPKIVAEMGENRAVAQYYCKLADFEGERGNIDVMLCYGRKEVEAKEKVGGTGSCIHALGLFCYVHRLIAYQIDEEGVMAEFDKAVKYVTESRVPSDPKIVTTQAHYALALSFVTGEPASELAYATYVQLKAFENPDLSLVRDLFSIKLEECKGRDDITSAIALQRSHLDFMVKHTGRFSAESVEEFSNLMNLMVEEHEEETYERTREFLSAYPDLPGLLENSFTIPVTSEPKPEWELVGSLLAKYGSATDLPEGVTCCENALKVFEACKTVEEARIPGCLTMLGFVYERTGKHKEAREAFERAVDMYEESGPDSEVPGTFEAIYQLQMILLNAGEEEKARKLATTVTTFTDYLIANAEAMFEDDAEPLSAYLAELASRLGSAGHKDAMIYVLEHMAKSAEGEALAGVLVTLATALEDIVKFEEALEVLDRADAIMEEQWYLIRAEVQGRRIEALNCLGRTEEAIAASHALLRIADAAGIMQPTDLHLEELVCLIACGPTLMDAGQGAALLPYVSRVTAIMTERGNAEGLSQLLNMQVSVLISMRRDADALALMTERLPGLEAVLGSDHPYVAEAGNLIARLREMLRLNAGTGGAPAA